MASRGSTPPLPVIPLTPSAGPGVLAYPASNTDLAKRPPTSRVRMQRPAKMKVKQKGGGGRWKGQRSNPDPTAAYIGGQLVQAMQENVTKKTAPKVNLKPIRVM